MLTGEALPDRLKRVSMRSWRRGTKEMDLILGRFADARLAEMDAATLDAFEALLEEADSDLYPWFTRRVTAPERHDAMLQALRRFHEIA